MYGAYIVLIICVIGLIHAEVLISNSVADPVSIRDKVPILCHSGCTMEINEAKTNASIQYTYTVQRPLDQNSQIGFECVVNYMSCGTFSCSNEIISSPTSYLNISSSNADDSIQTTISSTERTGVTDTTIFSTDTTTRITDAFSSLYTSTVQSMSHVYSRLSDATKLIVTQQTDRGSELTDDDLASGTQTNRNEINTIENQEETTSGSLLSTSNLKREHTLVVEQNDTKFYKSGAQTFSTTSARISIHIENTETLTYGVEDNIYVTCDLHFNQTIYSFGGLLLMYKLARSDQAIYNRACPEGHEYSYATILLGEDNCMVTPETPETHSYTFTTQLEVNQSQIETGSFTCAGFFNKGVWFWTEIRTPPIEVIVIKSNTDDVISIPLTENEVDRNTVELTIADFTSTPNMPEIPQQTRKDEQKGSSPSSKKRESAVNMEYPTVSTSLVVTPPSIEFSITGELDEENNFQVGKNATFSCFVQLSERLNIDLIVDGLTISSQREFESLEGGCLNHSYSDFTKLLGLEFASPCVIRNHGNTYSWSHQFNITKDYIGIHNYQCNFRVWRSSVDWLSWAYSRKFSHILMSSDQIEYSAILRPIIKLKPEILSGFEGEEIVVTCSATESYPVGNLTLQLGENEISTSEDSFELMLNIPLTKETSREIVSCSHSAYEELLIERKIQVMYLRRLKRGNVTIVVSSNQDIVADCSAQLQISGEVNYEWSGDLISLADKHNPRFTITYRDGFEGRQFPIKCHASLKDDPMKRSSDIDFTLVYKNGKPLLSKFTFKNFLITVGFGVAVYSLAVVAFTCKELYTPIDDGKTTSQKPDDGAIFEGMPMLTLRDVKTQTKRKKGQSKKKVDSPQISQSETRL